MGHSCLAEIGLQISKVIFHMNTYLYEQSCDWNDFVHITTAMIQSAQKKKVIFVNYLFLNPAKYNVPMY